MPELSVQSVRQAAPAPRQKQTTTAGAPRHHQAIHPFLFCFFALSCLPLAIPTFPSVAIKVTVLYPLESHNFDITMQADRVPGLVFLAT